MTSCRRWYKLLRRVRHVAGLSGRGGGSPRRPPSSSSPQSSASSESSVLRPTRWRAGVVLPTSLSPYRSLLVASLSNLVASTAAAGMLRNRITLATLLVASAVCLASAKNAQGRGVYLCAWLFLVHVCV